MERLDVLIVTSHITSKNPLDRIKLIEKCLKKYPNVEPIILTIEEFIKAKNKNNPIIEDVIRSGIILANEINV